jgi:hypothetical protein
MVSEPEVDGIDVTTKGSTSGKRTVVATPGQVDVNFNFIN